MTIRRYIYFGNPDRFNPLPVLGIGEKSNIALVALFLLSLQLHQGACVRNAPAKGNGVKLVRPSTSLRYAQGERIGESAEYLPFVLSVAARRRSRSTGLFPKLHTIALQRGENVMLVVRSCRMVCHWVTIWFFLFSTPGVTSAASETDASWQQASLAENDPTMVGVNVTPESDLAVLRARIQATAALSIFEKISLRCRVENLLAQFRQYHRDPTAVLLRELHTQFTQLIADLTTQLRVGDPALCRDLQLAQERLWRVLVDPVRFAQL